VTEQPLAGDPPGVVLPRSFYRCPSTDLAPRLLNKVLVHGDGAVRIVEVEAYGGADDPASHAFRGPTARNATMFGSPGLLYVYFTYGMHWCANVVCGPGGSAAAVLLRAGEVVEGADVARARRPAARRDVDLARGPARLTQALGLTGADDGAAIGARVRLALAPRQSAVSRGPRVGVAGPGGEPGAFPWRFWVPGEPTVTAYRPGHPRRPRARTEMRGPDEGAGHGRLGTAPSTRQVREGDRRAEQ
jgi:DNA-3-methyladenine glycosylase